MLIFSVADQMQALKSNVLTQKSHCYLKHHVCNQKCCLHVLLIYGQSNTYQPSHSCRKHHMSNRELKSFLPFMFNSYVANQAIPALHFALTIIT